MHAPTRATSARPTRSAQHPRSRQHTRPARRTRPGRRTRLTAALLRQQMWSTPGRRAAVRLAILLTVTVLVAVVSALEMKQLVGSAEQSPAVRDLVRVAAG